MFRAQLISLVWVAVLAGSAARADDHELRPPETDLEIGLGPREDAAEVRVFWVCYERDLGAAARAWVGERIRTLDCASAGASASGEREREALQARLEAAAGGRALGEARKGEVREVDAAPGREKQVSANFCYSGADVDRVVDWAARQLAARCAEAAPAQAE